MRRVLLGGTCLILSLWAAQVRWNVRHTLCVLVMHVMGSIRPGLLANPAAGMHCRSTAP
jgi:hypothetical protein